MILFLNASPKLKNSNSKYFLDLLRIDNITNYIYEDNFDDIINNIKLSDTIVFAFPTYADIIPSKLIEFIEYYKGNFKNKNIYVIVNCGFLESIHNELSIEYMRYYINKKKGTFKGYFNIGSGEIMKFNKSNKLFKILCLDFFKKIKLLSNSIKDNKNIYLTTNFKWLNKKMFCKICNHYWDKKINSKNY